MHCFRIARSAIAVHRDYHVARHPLEDIALTEPQPEPERSDYAPEKVRGHNSPFR